MEEQTDPILRRLLDWSRRQERGLPWRGTRDPYRIWISEVMLQQTTVSAVRGRYEAFLSRFPDLPSLARAREDSVLSAWSGLGYYARARNLRRAARRILQKHGGRIPRDPRTMPDPRVSGRASVGAETHTLSPTTGNQSSTTVPSPGLLRICSSPPS